MVSTTPTLLARSRVYLISDLIQAVPLVTQSDGGSENFGIANAHTMIRHRLDPSLSETLQHQWMRKSHNIKSEINWSVFRRDFAPGFEDILQRGVNSGWYDINNLTEKYVHFGACRPCVPRLTHFVGTCSGGSQFRGSKPSWTDGFCCGIRLLHVRIVRRYSRMAYRNSSAGNPSSTDHWILG